MKLGFMIYSLSRALADGTLDVPSAFELMRKLGAEGVDISVAHVQGYSNAEVRRMVEDAGLVVSCYIGGSTLTVGDRKQRAKALDDVRRLIEDAAEVGAQTMLVTPGVCAAGQSPAEGRRNVAAALAQLIPHAQQHGITLTIEDFGAGRSPYQTSAECLECCELAGPQLRITYDTGNMVMGDEDPIAFLQASKHLVVHAHAKDWKPLPAEEEKGLVSRAGKRYIGTVVGQGILDYPAIIKALKDMNYEGFLSFEYEGTDDPVAAATQGMAYLRELVQ